ncbi:hypothetical protein L1987_30213 [Smallanthus sonchifolius]|uniref:Uncharacterized protein n=1 Tax=Smallanthus sonchifolius TaxID=185202 RepID=A0ACB9I1L3_9ASTR|nr:hypothetical protein L1987_30213 [Smallanthus sonchifolius]
MAELKKIQERKAVILLREQQIQWHARQLDTLKQEMREEWTDALISQGEDADYLEKLSNKEIYRAFMGQQGYDGLPEGYRREWKEARSHELYEPASLICQSQEGRGREIGEDKIKEWVNTQTDDIKQKKTKPTPSSTPSLSNNLPLSLLDLPPLHPKSPNPFTQLLLINSLPRRKPNLQPQQNIQKKLLPGSIAIKINGLRFLGEGQRIMELGEAHEPENECGRHLLLVIKHHFNPSKDVIGQKMRCSSKAIFSMPSKDIKSLSELPLDNPSKDPRGYETARIVTHMQKLQQQQQTTAADSTILLLTNKLLRIRLASQQHQTLDVADRQIINIFDFATDTSATTLTHLSAEGMLLVKMIKDKPLLKSPTKIPKKSFDLNITICCSLSFSCLLIVV